MSMHYTEMTFASRVVEWMNEIIERERLPFDRADVEIMDPTKKRPDIILWHKRMIKKAFLLEVKRPDADPWGEVLDDALSKAWRNNIPYFATWNVNRFFSWETFESGDVIDKLWFPHSGASEVVAPVKSLDEIDRYEDPIKKFLRDFLKEFADIYYQVKAKPPLAIDERFIYRLRAAMDALSIPVFDALKNRYAADERFREGLRKWFLEQGWTFSASDEDFEKVARQYVLLLIDKIMFYNVLSMKRKLPKIEMPIGVSGEQFKDMLQSYFKECLREDYETVFSTNFLDSITPPDVAAGQLKDFTHKIGEHDFAKIGYEILGRIFERLIPDEERHKLGQYFTRPDVVDLIVGFCVKDPDDKVIDGGCGAGTFLVRSYIRKKQLKPSKTHKELLEELYGIDIAKFPAHLTTINLAIRDLSETENYPKVLCKDFFDIRPGKESTLIPVEYLTEGLSLEKIKVKIPLFDSVAMNPPYTRRGEMELAFPEGYTQRLRGLVEKEWKIPLGGWFSIYAYFFMHGGKFLKKHGKMGLITSNSWLNVDYGRDLQTFFLQNFKIIAVIESKVERWFEDADIITAITILERCDVKEERESNLVKFIQLKKPLSCYIPAVTDEIERWKSIDKLVAYIEDINELYEDENIKVHPQMQSSLWTEGFNEVKKRYEGSNWGKYLRAPNVAFEILRKCNDKLIPLGELAKVSLGLTTGLNEFFYLADDEIKKWGIESQFLKPLIKSPREFKNIFVDKKKLKLNVFIIDKDKEDILGTNALKYIMWGENQGIPKRPFFKAKMKTWYKLTGVKEIPIILAPNLYWKRHGIFYNEPLCVIDKKLIGIQPHNQKLDKALCSFLNSTFAVLIKEILGRTPLGQGALDISTDDYRELLVLNLGKLDNKQLRELEDKLMKLSERPIKHILQELGAESPDEVSLDKVEYDRLELDNIIFDILGLSVEERLEVYKGVVDLVKSRIERAQSVKKGRKPRGIDVGSLVESVLEEASGKLRRFPDAYIGSFECKVINVPRGPAEAGSDLQGFYIRIGGKEIRCGSPHEAKYIEYAVLNGCTSIKIPTNEAVIKRLVKEYGKLLKDAKKLVSDFVDSSIPDRKLRERVKAEVWRRLGA